MNIHWEDQCFLRVRPTPLGTALSCTSLLQAAPLRKQGETGAPSTGGGEQRPHPGAEAENADAVSQGHQIKAKEEGESCKGSEDHSGSRGSSVSMSALLPNVK